RLPKSCSQSSHSTPTAFAPSWPLRYRPDTQPSQISRILFAVRSLRLRVRALKGRATSVSLYMRSFLRRSRISTATCALIIAVAVLSPRAAGAPASRVPRLIVLLVVDQMRGDYVDRFEHQWTAGLHRLVTQGAWFRQARYPYYNTITCAGHASIST